MIAAHWLGRIPVHWSEYLFDCLAEERSTNAVPDTLLILEHPPTFTLHRDLEERDRKYIRADPLWFDFDCAQKNIAVVSRKSGGGIMYHGPGQLILAPVMALDSKTLTADDYKTALIETMRRILQDCYGIEANAPSYDRASDTWRTEDNEEIPIRATPQKNLGVQGVWTKDDGMIKKIGFLGYRIGRSIATRGCALNICPDLEPFSMIDPCNLPGIEVTSVERITGFCPVIGPELASLFAHTFAEMIGRENEVLFVNPITR